MRFLCLHGLGTNSQIFETQTAAIRYELGDFHTYEFVEGTIPAPMAPEFAAVASPTDEFLAYADFDDLPTCIRALDQLETYLAVEGPFDGVLVFSQGTTIAATYVAHLQTVGRPMPFRCAIFFSGAGAFDVGRAKEGQVRLLTPKNMDQLIQIPTGHIWGINDMSVNSIDGYAACAPDRREMFVHEGGHEIPGVRSPLSVKSCVRVIRRVVSLASRHHEAKDNVTENM